MFLVTQFIGLAVVNSYLPKQQTILNETTGQYQTVNVTSPLPYGMQPPELKESWEFWSIIPNIIVSFTIAIALIFLLAKYKWKFVIRTWFFLVIIIALAISFNAFFKNFFDNTSLLVLLLAIPLAFIKIYRPNIFVHNFTELLIYPGIAAVFVPILNTWTIIILLVLISFYDMWAVWRSGIMQKMAKFQMNELKIFGGFLVPYIPSKVREQIAKFKKMKGKVKGKRIKISLAILGGGDVVFPIIAAGVFLKFYGLIPALFIIAGAASALVLLFSFSEKKKFYPAMPFITGGIFLGILLSWLFGFL